MKHLFALLLFVLLATSAVLAVCTVSTQNADYSLESGSANTAVLNANVNAVGDLVAFTAWCFPGCTPASVTLGNQSATRTAVSGTSSADTGQGFIYYILSAADAGPQQISWTVSGTHSGIQVSYVDFTPSAGCLFAHHVDSPLGSGSGGTANTPSIVASGDLLFNFTWSSQHIDSVNAPWSCPIYMGPGEARTCEFVNTINAAAYILSAPSGATANNITLNNNAIIWQALLTSFSLGTGGVRPAPPTNLSGVVN